MDENLDPLGYLMSTGVYTPNMAEKAKQEVGGTIVSRKPCFIEQNRQKFEPSGLYIQCTYAQYGRKSQTGSQIRQTGS